jgi:hypothetical protein
MPDFDKERKIVDDALKIAEVSQPKQIEEGDIVSYSGDLFEYQKGMGLREPQHLRGYSIERHNHIVKDLMIKIAELEAKISRLTTQTYKECYYGDLPGSHHSHEVCYNCQYNWKDEKEVGCYYKGERETENAKK